jgi:hypothetical protein
MSLGGTRQGGMHRQGFLPQHGSQGRHSPRGIAARAFRLRGVRCAPEVGGRPTPRLRDREQIDKPF